MYWVAIFATKGSCGFASVKSEQMDSRTWSHARHVSSVSFKALTQLHGMQETQIKWTEHGARESFRFFF